MYQFFADIILNTGLSNYASIMACAACLVVTAVVCILARWVVKYLMTRFLARIAQRGKVQWLEIMLDKKLFDRLSDLAIPLTVGMLAGDLADISRMVDRMISLLFIIIILRVFDSCIKSAGDIYAAREVSKTYPIRGLLQVIEIMAFSIAGIVAVSILINKSPAALLGSIGAMTAITSLIFKDAILGFVSGIQLTGNDMIRIGDWIELPKHSANGTVIDLSMTTVKVENFDKTITMIPAYTLVSESFINWRGMINTGARRIKRSLCVDATGIRFSETGGSKDGQPAQATEEEVNLGRFRAYMMSYLKQHPGINKDLVIMVRQLESDGNGIPLEIYAFTNTAVWVEYEGIQADIFDHLYAVISDFDLKLYQNPSSYDMTKIGRADDEGSRVPVPGRIGQPHNVE